ncbi:DinB family protein [Paenibacillus gorillae]|uniref:DinB family protein n=1 Tax=Paenibacillus gorillae TaxID=1243662 RepID=UPI0004B393E1|nr:DinB family protein [Paenibacillus gorillae]
MSNQPADVQGYLNTHDQLQEAIKGLDATQLKWKETPEKWSVTEVLTHLADHNIVVSFRIRDILADTKATLPAFSQDLWVSGQQGNQGDASDVLALFKALLVYNSLLFGRLSEADWGKSGINFKGDAVSVAAAVEGFTNHVQRHIGQIGRIKEAYSKI